jgi:wyosine [tRNA(Phe)-imidazoG37] synthetase (radical SAM superfamily)
MPKILRKQITFATIFRPRNSEEWETIRKEILQMKEEDGKKIFDYVFNQPYQHLDIDAFENKIYKNFNLLNITDTDKI